MDAARPGPRRFGGPFGPPGRGRAIAWAVAGVLILVAAAGVGVVAGVLLSLAGEWFFGPPPGYGPGIAFGVLAALLAAIGVAALRISWLRARERQDATRAVPSSRATFEVQWRQVAFALLWLATLLGGIAIVARSA